MHKIYTKTLLLTLIVIMFSSFYAQGQATNISEPEQDIKPVTAILMTQGDEEVINTMIDINPDNDRDSANIKVEEGETVSTSENSNYVIGLTSENDAEEESQEKVIDAPLSGSLVDEIKAFPNPATDYLNLQFTSRGTYEVYIFNLVGNVEQQYYVDNESDYRMDVTELQTGVYILQVAANGEMNSIRIKIAR